MPQLVQLYIRSVAIGFGLSAGFAVVLIWLDVMGVGRLILNSPDGWIVALMLLMSNGIVFSGVQFGIRIMMMAEDDTPVGGSRQRRPMPAPATAPATASVPARARKSR